GDEHHPNAPASHPFLNRSAEGGRNPSGLGAETPHFGGDDVRSGHLGPSPDVPAGALSYGAGSVDESGGPAASRTHLRQRWGGGLLAVALVLTLLGPLTSGAR